MRLVSHPGLSASLFDYRCFSRIGRDSRKAIIPMPPQYLLTGLYTTPPSHISRYQSFLLLFGLVEIGFDEPSMNDKYIALLEGDACILTASLENGEGYLRGFERVERR